MKKILLFSSLFLLVSLVSTAAFVELRFRQLSRAEFPLRAFSIHAEVAQADKALGERIYRVRAGCVDCHGSDLSGALVMENGAMGRIRGANLTPFALAAWSDEEIARAIRFGVHRSGRSLRFMPSADYEGLSKSDLAALIAFLRSAPPVEKPSQENSFGPIAKMLSVLGKMPVMFPARAARLERAFAEKPPEAPDARFGEYLAQSCTGCHGAELRGGPIPGGDPAWPPAAAIRLGADASYNAAEFAKMLRTGVSPRTKQPLRAPMPVALLQQLNDLEISALWAHLSSLN